jgi:hypothetical protein
VLPKCKYLTALRVSRSASVVEVSASFIPTVCSISLRLSDFGTINSDLPSTQFLLCVLSATDIT